MERGTGKGKIEQIMQTFRVVFFFDQFDKCARGGKRKKKNGVWKKFKFSSVQTAHTTKKGGCLENILSLSITPKI